MAIILFCRNGHDLSDYDQTIRMGPLRLQDVVRMAQRARWESQQPKHPFCPKCGASTLDACEHCKAIIPDGRRPSYCRQCGKPYPWMQDRLDTARDLLWHDEKLSLE